MSAIARKVIYIVGLSHSGSTILDMLLTTSRKAVGLGQVWTVLCEDPGRREARQCSCGRPAPECEMWGPILGSLTDLPTQAGLANRYRIVLEQAATLYGSEIAVIDSSKQACYLRSMTCEIADLDLKVLHNMKDVRSFTISALNNSARKDRDRELPEKIFYKWYRDNRRLHDTVLRLIGAPPIRVMYEAVCLSKEVTTARLNEALSDHYIDSDAALDSGHTHIISGNRTRLPEAGTNKRLVYDYQWLSRSEWLRPYILLPMVRRYNEQCLRDVGTSPGAT